MESPSSDSEAGLEAGDACPPSFDNQEFTIEQGEDPRENDEGSSERTERENRDEEYPFSNGWGEYSVKRRVTVDHLYYRAFQH
jgi:hypothetical protein